VDSNLVILDIPNHSIWLANYSILWPNCTSEMAFTLKGSAAGLLH